MLKHRLTTEALPVNLLKETRTGDCVFSIPQVYSSFVMLFRLTNTQKKFVIALGHERLVVYEVKISSKGGGIPSFESCLIKLRWKYL